MINHTIQYKTKQNKTYINNKINNNMQRVGDPIGNGGSL